MTVIDINIYLEEDNVMKKQLFDLFGSRYEYLIYDLLMFFVDNSIKSRYVDILNKHGVNTALHYKSVMDFVLSVEKKYVRDAQTLIQPNDVYHICEILNQYGYLSKQNFAFFNNMDGMNSFYIGFDRGISKFDKNILSIRLNSLVYGFQYIYKICKSKVLPIVVKKIEKDKEHIGTCFKSIYGIVTAKHCIDGYDFISIDGYDLKNAGIILHNDVDLALIIPTNYNFLEGLLLGKYNVLDDVIALGYPSISGFTQFLNGTVGSITAIEKSYLSHGNLMLLTCPIKGGNSGGPIINELGEVVGVITDLPYSEGNQSMYDNFGYGCATPIEYIDDLIKK